MKSIVPLFPCGWTAIRFIVDNLEAKTFCAIEACVLKPVFLEWIVLDLEWSINYLLIFVC